MVSAKTSKTEGVSLLGVQFADDIRVLATSYDETGPVLERLVNVLRQLFFS